MPLRILPDHLVNQIAAGEVIERPSAAVKELVENAIDAKATQIEIRIRDGGRSLISVSDDGKGMTSDELSLAIQRHATSKLDNEDLLHIQTMGFRGEALPSIASVARLKIISRTSDSENAWEINVNAGQSSGVQPSARSQGTLVEVSDLFYATPARLKFLKTTRAESMAISDIIQRLAMANPYVSFRLHNEAKQLLYYPAATESELSQARLTRLKSVLGKEFAENATPVDTMRDDARLSGWVSLPTFNRATADKQFLFINNRSVRDRLLHGAIRGGYQGWIADGRHALCALYIDMPYDGVDVNVHPAKTEVRFRDAAGIRSLLVGGIRQAITGSGFQASSTTSHQALDYLKVGGAEQPNKSYELFRNEAHESSSPFKNLPHMQASHPSYSQNVLNQALHQNVQDYAHSAQVIAEETPTNSEAMSQFPLGLARAQLHENYIVAQTNNSIILVDQHAAHERITHQKIEADLAKNGVMSQSLLLPEVMNLSPQEAHILLERQSELEELGLIIESFGEDAILVRATPALLGECDVEGLIKDLASELLTYDEATSLKSKLSHICATMACHGSIRSGRRLNAEEMNHLLRQIETTPGAGQCSHGRPTWVELKLHDIEKLFGRR
ncbi:MAG: DNA mismatch repair endonuclease MutL [Alphaproteobacteria bacterium]